MILLDDNFLPIVTGIAEGRLIFANLKEYQIYFNPLDTGNICIHRIRVAWYPCANFINLVLLIDLGD